MATTLSFCMIMCGKLVYSSGMARMSGCRSHCRRNRGQSLSSNRHRRYTERRVLSRCSWACRSSSLLAELRQAGHTRETLADMARAENAIIDALNLSPPMSGRDAASSTVSTGADKQMKQGTDPFANMPRCGAKTRAGTPCQRIGNSRNGTVNLALQIDGKRDG
jgi:hypothetical protein